MNRTPIEPYTRMAKCQRAVRALEEAAETHWLMRFALRLALIAERQAETHWSRTIREKHERSRGRELHSDDRQT